MWFKAPDGLASVSLGERQYDVVDGKFEATDETHVSRLSAQFEQTIAPEPSGEKSKATTRKKSGED